MCRDAAVLSKKRHKIDVSKIYFLVKIDLLCQLKVGGDVRLEVEVALTETQIKKAELAAKIYELADGHGLFVQVRPTGSKVFVK